MNKFAYYGLLTMAGINASGLIISSMDQAGFWTLMWAFSFLGCLYMAGFRLVRKESAPKVNPVRQCTLCARLESTVGKRCLFSDDKKHNFITIKF